MGTLYDHWQWKKKIQSHFKIKSLFKKVGLFHDIIFSTVGTGILIPSSPFWSYREAKGI